MLTTFLVLSLAINFLTFQKSSNEDKIFQGVLLFSNLYFCGGAYYFWLGVQESYFVGIIWGESTLSRSILVLTFATTFVSLIILLFSRRATVLYIERGHLHNQKIPNSLWVLLAFGFLGSLIVFVQGIFGDGDERGDYFLIAYQISDLFIPVILFLFATKGVNKVNLTLLSYFVIYASLVGFRYKIALLAIPLIAMLLFSRVKQSRKNILVTLIGAGFLILFTLLTLFRSKFSGIDTTRDLDNIWLDLQYGLFAESNIIFGLGSVLSQNIDKDHYYYLQPIYDVFREWVPRFLMPDRETGQYLRPMQIGFLSEEGEKSGTAYPFIGEFAIMLGWWGIGIGLVAYASLYLYLKKQLAAVSTNKNLWFSGLGLVAAIMAYYHYSRGYLPQIAKSYLFVILPYLYLCAQYKRKCMKLRSSMRPTINTKISSNVRRKLRG